MSRHHLAFDLHKELWPRAVQNHLRIPGARQPSERHSGFEVVDGKRYFVLRNTFETLGVYSVSITNQLRRLAELPQGVTA